MPNDPKKPVIVYDGECRLCQEAVKFLSMTPRRGGYTPTGYPAAFEFIPASDPSTDSLLNQHNISRETTDKTVILVENNRVYTKSTAIIRALRKKGGIWRLTTVFLLIPSFMRNLVYDWVANHRKIIIK